MFFQRMCGPRLYFNNGCCAGSEYALVSSLPRNNTLAQTHESHFERDVRQFILAYNWLPSSITMYYWIHVLRYHIQLAYLIQSTFQQANARYCFQYYKSQWEYRITVNRINLVQLELIIVRWASILGLKFLAGMFEML